MWQVGLKGNMLWMVDSDGTLLDSPKDWVFFRKDTLTGTTYSLYSKDGKTLIEGEGKSFKNVPIAQIESLNSEFTDYDSTSFEDWYSENVGFNSALGSSKVINTIHDLPSPVGGVITLLDDLTYYFTTDIDLVGNRLVLGSDTTILGASSENCSITSTGLSAGVALITSTQTNPIRHITIKDVDTALDFDGTGNAMALDWTGVNIENVPNIGTIREFSNFIFSKGAFINSQGLILDGEFDTVGIDNSLLQGDGTTGNIIEIPSTAVINRRFRIIYSAVIAFGSTTALNVSTSATISNEGYILDTVNFSGGSTYTSGVQYNDNKALFRFCRGIQNSSEVSQYYMTGNATTTTIAATGTPVKISGTTISGTPTEKFLNTDNRSTYLGALTRVFKVTTTLSCESGNNNQVGGYIAKNGTVLNESEVYITTNGSGRAENMVIQTLVELSQNDYIENWTENNTSTNNVLVTDMNTIIQ